MIVKSAGRHGAFSADHDLRGPHKFQTRPVPRVGGLSIFAALAAGGILLAFTRHPDARWLWLLLACMAFSRARKLYAVMFMLALAMEIYGTALGNWAWHGDVPWLGLNTLNPPLAAGAFYCVLDLLVVGTAGAVYPAAGLAHQARAAGARVVVVNPAPSELDGTAHGVLRGTAAEVLPQLLGAG